ncbi:MAG TPA: hypothetical protein VN317_03425, partial [Candidatus Methanoperedens sp.]|nr:hypothetical protein [Candidatus Methanoperedens sp.]
MCERALRRMLLPALVLLGWSIPAWASPSGQPDGGSLPPSSLFARLTTQQQHRFLHEVFDFTLTVCSRGLALGREISLLNQETPGFRFFAFRDLGGGREVIDG